MAPKSEPQKEQANCVDEKRDDDSDEYEMYQVSSDKTQPLVIPVKINGVDIDMELDTGASVSLVSEEKLRQWQKSTSITLKPSKAKLLTYTKEAIGVVGSTEVTVEHNQQSATLPLIVTKGAGPWS